MEGRRGLRLRKSGKAVSQLLVTVVITSTLVVLVLAAVAVAQQVLQSYWPQNDLATGKEFMVSVGNSLDDVAWNPGRSDVVPYSTHVGSLAFFKDSINYTITITYNVTETVTVSNSTSFITGIFLYRLPLRYYTISDPYFERLPVNILENDPVGLGANASANRVFLVRSSPGVETEYIIIAVVPRLRLINNTIKSISVENKTTVYYRLYIANLTLGTVAATRRDITLQGTGYTIQQFSKVTNITVQVSFPKWNVGFSEGFFHFSTTTQSLPVPEIGGEIKNVVVEVYVGDVTLSYR